MANVLKMAATNVGKGLLLKSDPIASAFRDEIKAALAKTSRRPRLVGILATAGAPSKMYADFTKKQCEELGFEFVLKTVGSAADSTLRDGEGVEEAIIEANNDNDVDGIMVGTYTCPCCKIMCIPTIRFAIVLKVYYPIFGVQQVCAYVRILTLEPS